MSHKENDGKPQSRMSVAWAVLIPASVMLLYVLSIGPSSRLMGRLNRTEHHETMEFIIWFYRPLTYICEQSEALQTTMDWYQSLWG
jgi:hypothetical protein